MLPAFRPSAPKAASVGANTVSCSPLVRASATAGSAQPTAATRVVKLPFATAVPTIVSDDRDGGTTTLAAEATGTAAANIMPASASAPMDLRIIGGIS